MAVEYKTKCWDLLAAPGGIHGCVLTWCCPCITYGINASKLKDAPATVFWPGQFTSSCAAFCVASLVGCHCLLQMPMRKYIREKYGITPPANEQLEDFLYTWCCGCCVLIQEYNEIASHEGAPEGGIFTEVKAAMETAKADAVEYKKSIDAKAAKKPEGEKAEKPKEGEAAAPKKEGEVDVKEAVKEAKEVAKAADKALDKVDKVFD